MGKKHILYLAVCHKYHSHNLSTKSGQVALHNLVTGHQSIIFFQTSSHIESASGNWHSLVPVNRFSSRVVSG